MADQMILLIVLVIAIFAVKGTIKHFRGEGACCGGGGKGLSRKEMKKKKLKNPKIGEKTVKISGMHCEHCAGCVEAALNQIEGVSAKVSLQQKTAIVSYDREISEKQIRTAVEDAGYVVVSIQ